MARTGRPKKIIDKKNFESMCAYQCTLEEICAFMGVTDVTLNKWCKKEYGTTFSDVFKQKRELGKMSLRRKQWALADKNASMAIFLGKQYLGQKDSIEVEDRESLSKLDEILKGMKTAADAVKEPSPQEPVSDDAPSEVDNGDA